jgi:hypothetical protein
MRWQGKMMNGTKIDGNFKKAEEFGRRYRNF